MWGMIGAHRYVAAAIQGSDQDGVVFSLSGQAQIVGKTRGDFQINATFSRSAPQEIGLNLDVAGAEKQQIDPQIPRREILWRQRHIRSKIGGNALAGYTPEAIEHLDRIAPMIGVQDLRDMLKFFFRCFARQDSTLDQSGQNAIGCVLVWNIPAGGKAADYSGKFYADRHSGVPDRVNKQDAIGAHRQQVYEARQTQIHCDTWLTPPANLI
jgi:hypothetical protein